MNNNLHSTITNPHLRPLIIFGSGGHALSVANVALSAGYKIKYFVDKFKKGSHLLGYEIIEEFTEWKNTDNLSFSIAVGDNSFREKLHNELCTKNTNLYFPSLIHPSAIISFSTDIGIGSVVMANAVIGPNTKIGNFCLINTLASIDHDCVMLDYSSLAPAAVTGGSVSIGIRSAICIGAKIKHKLKIGNDSILGANSYLNKDLSSNQVAYGTPARPVRRRNNEDTYL
jgi:sugar O-acyltransferase (sialic acid O-acetyltransferase NeuD family)